MPETDSGIVYHYCSLEAFKSIIENKCLWLCDVQKSNDSKECLVLPETFRTLVETNDELNAMTEQRLLLDRMLHMVCNTARQTFVTCFSRKRDDLNQWRGYAADGTGLCIGFRKKYFVELNQPEWNVLTYAPVDYEQGADDCALVYFDEFKGMMQNFQCNHLILHDEQALRAENELLHRLWSIAPMFKKRAFREEEEERLVFSVKNTFIDYQNVSTQKCVEVQLDKCILSYFNDQNHNFSLSELKYRIARSTLQGYYELSFDAIADKLIAEIIIGPKCSLSPVDVYIFLAANGYHAKKRSENSVHYIFKKTDINTDINIYSSELTYR